MPHHIKTIKSVDMKIIPNFFQNPEYLRCTFVILEVTKYKKIIQMMPRIAEVIELMITKEIIFSILFNFKLVSFLIYLIYKKY